MEKMTRQEIEEMIAGMLVEEFRCKAGDVVPEATLCDDLEADSLDRIDLVLRLEQEFGITIDGRQFLENRSFCVKDVCDMVEQLLEEKEKNQ